MMIEARRVLDVANFLKPGEQWRLIFDTHRFLGLTIFGVESGVVKMEMHTLLEGENGRYIRRAFSLTDLNFHEDRVGHMALELVRMAIALGVYDGQPE
jgi:hypothetical protein